MKKSIFYITILLISLFMFSDIRKVRAEQVTHCVYEQSVISKTVLQTLFEKTNRDWNIFNNVFDYVEMKIDVEPIKNGLFMKLSYTNTKYNLLLKEKESGEIKSSTVTITYNNNQNTRIYSGQAFAQGVFAEDFYLRGDPTNPNGNGWLCPALYIDSAMNNLSNGVKKFFSIAKCPICNMLVPINGNEAKVYSTRYRDGMANDNNFKQLIPQRVVAEQSSAAKSADANQPSGNQGAAANGGGASTANCDIFGKEGSQTRKMISWAIKLIRYIIPILVIVLSIADYLGVVFSGEEDKMKETGKKVSTRLVVAVVFLLVPFLLEFLVNVTDLMLDTGISSSDLFCGFLD